jgi:acyl-CoA dehydrogenase
MFGHYQPYLEDRHRQLESQVRAELAGVRFDHDPRRTLALLAERGLLRACVHGKYGGLAERIELRNLVVLRMVLAEHSSLADTMFAMQGLGSFPVLFGSEAQQQALLPGVADGRLMCAFAITEPEAGSDVSAIRSRAERRGDDYVLSGEKIFISNAGLADRYVLFARTGEDRKHGLSAFVVEADRPGLSAEPMRVLGDHPIGRLRLSNLTVPASSRIGEEGEGMRIALETLDLFRTTVGAAAVGMAQRALDEARARVRTRVQFGKPLAAQQATQLSIAEMAVDVQAARLLCLDAAYFRDIDPTVARGAHATKAAMAKLFATEAAQRVIDRAVQLWGGAGLVEDAVVARLYTEIRALRIYEGTSEIQRLVIARAELG